MEKTIWHFQEGMYHYHTVVNGWEDIGQHLTLFPDGSWLTGKAIS